MGAQMTDGPQSFTPFSGYNAHQDQDQEHEHELDVMKAPGNSKGITPPNGNDAFV